MRPIKLTMQAFGPYAGKETIDFSSLGNRTMFVISGKTGAGKTTIFDAISYAIYGKASGEDRTGADLRSQFADHDVLTEVSLDFSLRGKMYKIIRTPQQEKQKERGEGTRTLPATATLYSIDEAGEPKLIASKINEVEEKVREIMLIDSNQFRQILMIPQGEFRKLLTSDSKDKEVILQRLFHTQLYKLVEEKLRAEAQELKKKVEDRQGMRNDALKRIQAVFDDELKAFIDAGSDNHAIILPLLKEEIGEMETEIERLSAKAEEKAAEQNRLKQQYFAAEEILKQMKHREEMEQKKQLLESQHDIFAGKEKEISLARKAALLSAQEELCRRLKKDADGAKLAVDELQKSINRLAELKALREQEWEKEKAREPERHQAVEQLNRLLNMKEDVFSFAEKEKAAGEAERMHARKKSELNSADAKLREAEELGKALLGQKAEIDQAQLDSLKNERSFDRNKAALERLSKLEVLRDREQKALAELNRKTSSFRMAEERYMAAKLQVEKLEEKWLKGQAAHLAATLVDGEPCPVCGSAHHPAPAANLDNDIPDEQALKDAKQQAAKLEQEKMKAETSFLESKSASSRLAEDLAAAAAEMAQLHPSFSLQEVKAFKEIFLAEQAEFSAEKAALDKKLRMKEGIDKQIGEVENSKLALQKEVQVCREQIGQLAVKEAELKTQLERMLSIVPEGLRSVPVFEKAVRDAKENAEALARQFENAEKLFRESGEKLTAETARLQDASGLYARKEKELAEERESFRVQMNGKGFENYSSYDQARRTDNEIAILEQQVRAYNEDLRVCADRLADLAASLAEVETPDLDSLALALSSIAAEIGELQKRGTDLYLKKTQNEEVANRVEALNQEMKTLEDRYNVVGHLSDIARGQNTYRLTFERFVLAAFLDDILREANGRLAKMTSGRFQLRRKTDRSKGNVQSGLELLVFDQYTAQERHVKTLSGGESFKASLSLALGLADVVQAHAGGVSLETMFIDEGFGTLDPESLDQAIDALIDIQSSGRLVGIISHVPELKERIDARLEVTSTQSGSITKFLVGI